MDTATPAVVLVHGWASDANYWNAQLEALKSRYTVVALNLAGHGASGNNRNDWSIANYAQDVAGGGATDSQPTPGAGRALHGSCGVAGGNPADRYAR